MKVDDNTVGRTIRYQCKHGNGGAGGVDVRGNGVRNLDLQDRKTTQGSISYLCHRLVWFGRSPIIKDETVDTGDSELNFAPTNVADFHAQYFRTIGDNVLKGCRGKCKCTGRHKEFTLCFTVNVRSSENPSGSSTGNVDVRVNFFLNVGYPRAQSAGICRALPRLLSSRVIRQSKGSQNDFHQNVMGSVAKTQPANLRVT